MQRKGRFFLRNQGYKNRSAGFPGSQAEKENVMGPKSSLSLTGYGGESRALPNTRLGGALSSLRALVGA